MRWHEGSDHLPAVAAGDQQLSSSKCLLAYCDAIGDRHKRVAEPLEAEERGVMSGPAFVPGLELAGGLYREVVGPLLADVTHSAALIGTGSDALGFDTPRSTDHGWGPRLQLFVDRSDVAAVAGRIDTGLPATFRGWPVWYGWGPVPVQHHVTVTTLPDWLTSHLGVDATQPLSTMDWLVTPQQLLLGVVAGTVFRDDTGALGRVRSHLAWYPDPLWRWMLGCQWRRLAQEEPFVQRTAEVGDELGSAVIAARLARDVMRLALLIKRRYAPYSKWLGSAFASLDHPDGLDRMLRAAVRAPDLDTREAALGQAYEAVARRFNQLALIDSVDPDLRLFHDRPARVLNAYRFADPCLASVDDPALATLPPIGAIDQAVDTSDALLHPDVYRRFRDAWADPLAGT